MAAKVTTTDGGQVELHTERLKLRGAIPGDVEYLNEPFTDPEVMRYW